MELMRKVEFLSNEFAEDFAAAGLAARRRALASGLPLVFVDEQGRYVQEMPDGRLFKIRFVPGAPRESHIVIVRELTSAAA